MATPIVFMTSSWLCLPRTPHVPGSGRPDPEAARFRNFCSSSLDALQVSFFLAAASVFLPRWFSQLLILGTLHHVWLQDCRGVGGTDIQRALSSSGWDFFPADHRERIPQPLPHSTDAKSSWFLLLLSLGWEESCPVLVLWFSQSLLANHIFQPAHVPHWSPASFFCLKAFLFVYKHGSSLHFKLPSSLPSLQTLPNQLLKLLFSTLKQLCVHS